jgi:hypothetical protein
MSLFLELDSTFRNRQQWPLPGEFEVLLSQTGRNTQQNMVDPTCTTLPSNTWTGAYFNENALGNLAVQGTVTTSCCAPVITLTPVFPATFETRKDYYKKSIVQNLTTPSQISTILESSDLGGGKMQIVVRNENFSFNVGDTLTILDSSDFSDPNNSYLFIPCSKQSYANQILYNETTGESRPISFDDNTGLLKIGGSTLGWAITNNFSLRPAAPNFVCTAGIGSTPSQVIVTGTAATSNTNFENWFVRFPRILYGNTEIAPQGLSRRIVKYDNASKVLTVNPPLPATPAGMQMQLMQSGYDNAIPFNTRMTVAGEIPTYRVQLSSLTIPNIQLAVGSGEKPAFSNFFYVELSNPDVSQAQFYSIFSNNPYSTRALFRVTVRNCENPDTMKFVPLKGDMVQTIRIRLDSNMRMRVFLPSTGETFQTIIPDTVSPEKPNDSVQICALFEFTPII